MQEVISAVVIDDQLSAIYGISKALCEAGISTFPIHYQKDATATKALCQKIAKTSPRVIITDIQLEHGGKSPSKTDISLVAGIIYEITKSLTGPYIVLAWTSQAAHVEALRDIIFKLCDAKTTNRPLFVEAIDKTECKDDDDADVYVTGKILDKFKSYLEIDKQLRALLHWEKGVMSAAHRTVNSLISVPNSSLADTLHQLGVQSVGETNLQNHESTAINNAISNILYDEIGQYSHETNTKEIWRTALDVAASEANSEARHKLNTLLHFDMFPKENIVFPGDVFVCDDLKPFFGKLIIASEHNKQLMEFCRNLIPKDTKQLKNLRVKVDRANEGQNKTDAEANLKKKYSDPRILLARKTKFVFLETSPACDFSNNKRELKPFSLGVVAPSSALVGVFSGKPPTDVLRCKIHWEKEDYTLMVSAKYQIHLSEKYVMHEAKAGAFKNRFRMRDSLLQSWIQNIAQYNSRIGTISFQ